MLPPRLPNTALRYALLRATASYYTTDSSAVRTCVQCDGAACGACRLPTCVTHGARTRMTWPRMGYTCVAVAEYIHIHRI